MSAPRPKPQVPAYPPRDDRAAADRRRYDLALGINLAVALALSFILALRFATDGAPEGRDLMVWCAMLGLVWAVIAGGLALNRAGRTAAATALLAFLAGPVAVFGLGLAPVALLSLSAVASAPAAFRDWVGPDLPDRITTWLITLSFIAALIPASLLTRRAGRYVLGHGIVVGACAMISVVLIGIAGGFLFRGVR